MKEHILRVTIKDCEIQTFRAGGKGGSHQNKTSSGVRIIHHPSGARGESREERSQLQNKRKAFVKMAESKEFRRWVGIESSRHDKWIEEQMAPENLLIEYGRSYI